MMIPRILDIFVVVKYCINKKTKMKNMDGYDE